MQPGFEPGTAVTPLALRCSVLDHCTTWEPPKITVMNYVTVSFFGIYGNIMYFFLNHNLQLPVNYCKNNRFFFRVYIIFTAHYTVL